MSKDVRKTENDDNAFGQMSQSGNHTTSPTFYLCAGLARRTRPSTGLSIDVQLIEWDSFTSYLYSLNVPVPLYQLPSEP